MTISELPIIAAPSQAFTTTLSGRRCDFLVQFNAWLNRWTFSLDLDGERVLTGRRIVTGVDLIAPFQLGIGALVAAPWGDNDAEPGRDELPAGIVRLFHIGEAA